MPEKPLLLFPSFCHPLTCFAMVLEIHVHKSWFSDLTGTPESNLFNLLKAMFGHKGITFPLPLYFYVLN